MENAVINCSVGIDIVVVDSVAALVPAAEIEGEINGESRKRMFEEETTNISVFGSNIGIDEETYNKLPSGTLYTVGNDATVRRKK